jgi:DNA polymerase/3'-5' exonuclease PolX
MELKQAHDIANEVILKIGKHFTKSLVCGSIRRKRPNVNDIDIVAIQKTNYEFGEPTLNDSISVLDPNGKKEASLLGKKAIGRYALGDDIKRFYYKGIQVEIWLANERNFGTLSLIKTGSKEFNVRLAILAKQKGLKLFANGEGLCKTAMIHNSEHIVERIATTEEDILNNLLNKVPKPEERFN